MKPIHILNQPLYQTQEFFTPFALTDVLIEDSGQQEQPYLHFWQLPQGMILGMKDTRLPQLQAALATLPATGYTPVVRNSGGLGVVADAGILNVSLILPLTNQKLSTDEAYEKMYHLIQQAFPEVTITTGEVATSYCPGEFDLSIEGQKIAGIAQRRIKNGVAIMLYLSVNGDQQGRGVLVRNFYQAGLKEAFGTQGYPPVDPTSMANLADFLPKMTPEEVIKRLSAVFPKAKHLDSRDWLNQLADTSRYESRLTSMAQRNQIIKEQKNDSL